MDYGVSLGIPCETIGLVPQDLYTICADGKGGVYVLQPNDTSQIVRLGYGTAIDNWAVQSVELEINPSYIHADQIDMKATADGTVWLLVNQKLYSLSGGTIQLRMDLSQSAGVLGKFHRLEVSNNNVWLLHEYRGLYRFDRNVDLIARLSTGTESNYRFDNLVADSDDNVWVSKDHYIDNITGLMNDGTWVNVNDPDSILACPTCSEWNNIYKYMYTSAADHAGIVYLFLNGGFFRIKDRTLEQMAPPIVFPLLVDHTNELWMYSEFTSGYYGSINPFLYHYEGSSDPTHYDLAQLFEGNVWLFDGSIDANDNIWMATNKGIAIYNRDGIRF